MRALIMIYEPYAVDPAVIKIHAYINEGRICVK